MPPERERDAGELCHGRTGVTQPKKGSRLTVPPGMPDAAHSAWRVALRRAGHQLYDVPVVFHDPFAVPLLGAAGREALGRTPASQGRQWSRSLRAFVVARSLFAEARLAEAYGQGTRQYCLLGAGLDTFALRNPWPDLRVWELDRPEVRGWKGELLRAAGLQAGGCERIPGDLLGTPWPLPGMDAGRPAVFAMLGVAPFLPTEALRTVLRRVRRFAPGSALVFDYRLPPEALPDEERRQFDSLQARATATGEPFLSGWMPEALRAELRGFARVEDLGRAELNERYFAGRADGLADGIADGLAIRGEAARMVCASF